MRSASRRHGVELTSDRTFSHRIKRLVAISLFALGFIDWLAIRSDGPTWAIVLITIGWILMPTLLFLSLARPRLRYGLIVPGVSVSLGLLGMTLATTGTEAAGWLLITIGVTVGGTMGMWLWFRWFPVPRSLDDPFGWPRIALVGFHIGLVLCGAGIVLTAT